MSATIFDAICQGDAAQVQSLLELDPQLGATRNADGATPVLWAIYTRHADLTPLLLGGREPDFFEACALGRRPRVEALLSQDPELASSFSPDGFPALGLAVFFGHLEIARILVSAGADVDSPSRNAIRVTPLHSAIASGSFELLDLLLSAGARPDPEEFLEMTPLHSAAAHGYREMVERLLQAGASRHHRTREGKTPAGLAREQGHPAIADLLES